MSNKLYSIIYADPPWQYNNKKTGGSMVSGSVAKYPTMSLLEICNLPIKNISHKDAVLFLWATTPLKWDAFQVLTSWGFTYKTTIYWHKTMSFGMGFWFRGQIEELLVGIKGNIKAFRVQKPNFIQTKVLAHSEKPNEFRKLIEVATENMQVKSRLELFARIQYPGWDVFGNQVVNSIDL